MAGRRRIEGPPSGPRPARRAPVGPPRRQTWGPREAVDVGRQCRLATQFKTGLAELRTEMAGQRAELTAQIAEVAGEVAEVRTEIANLDTRLSTQIADLG